MKTLRFDEAQLMRMLERLPRPLRTVFAAACAERLLPAYFTFSNKAGRGDAAALANILTWLWQNVASDRLTDSAIQAQLDACMELIPQENEGPWVNEQASAEDAGAAVAYALRCRKAGASQDAAWTARRLYEALDHYVINREKIDVNVPDAEARVIEHPLVQAELARQRRDLDELLGVGSEDVHQLATRLRERAKAEGAIFFGGA